MANSMAKMEGDRNTYTTGVVGRHNVVLAHMPGPGSTSAAAVAASLHSSFFGIELVLVVGICGVVPVHPETQEKFMLGDIVISTAVVQYDFGRQHHDRFDRKKNIETALDEQTQRSEASSTCLSCAKIMRG